MTPATFHKLLTTIGQAAELPFPVRPHMLRPAPPSGRCAMFEPCSCPKLLSVQF